MKDLWKQHQEYLIYHYMYVQTDADKMELIIGFDYGNSVAHIRPIMP